MSFNESQPEELCLMCNGRGVVGPPDDEYMCRCPAAYEKEAENAARIRKAMTPLEIKEVYSADGTQHLRTEVVVEGFGSE
jgi:hypothetical protein